MRVAFLLVLAAAAAGLLACGGDDGKGTSGKGAESSRQPEKPAPEKKPEEPRDEPELIKVQHVLISFRDAVGASQMSPTPTRTREEAEALAQQILERARAGDDFAALMAQYSDDTGGGTYSIKNDMTPARVTSPDQTLNRGNMVPAFGDVGFSLEVGGIGMGGYDPEASPYGWHVIKRIE